MRTAEPLVISYLRFSTPEQLKGDSKRRQTDAADRWCAANGTTLTDRLSDLGISAFRGANRKGALAEFLALVEAGTVPAGSTLLVEDLDRLSRQEPEEALHLFLSIIRAGVTIVTLIDGNEYRRGHLDMPRLTMSIMRIFLAHEESAKKSHRLAKAWQAKRANLIDKPITSRLPAWLRIVAGKIVVDEKRADVVRRMFKLANDGWGMMQITRELNRTTTGLARREYFNRSYVEKILHSEQVIGIYQPMRLTYASGEKKREPIGEAVRGYYPAIVSDDDFYSAQAAMRSRRNMGGPSAKWTNILSGRLYNCFDSSAMVTVTKHSNARQFASSAAIDGRKGADDYAAFPVVSMELAIVNMLASSFTDPAAQSGDDKGRQLATIEAKIDQVAAKIKDVQNAMVAAGNIAELATVIVRLSNERKELETRSKQLAGEVSRAERTSTGQGRYGFAAIAGRMQESLATEAGRVQLRDIIRTMVRRIEVDVTVDGVYRTAAISMTNSHGDRMNFTAKCNVRAANEVTITVSHEQAGDFSHTVSIGATTGSITPDKAERIKEMWEAGKGGAAIAKALGVSVSSVYRHKPAGWVASK